MANVGPSGRGSARTPRERAQLLIVIGIVLALALVSLALFLNSIIYAENVGSRGADVGGSEAAEYVAAAEAGGDGAIRTANAGNVTYENQTDAFADSVEDWTEISGIHYASSGSYASASSTGEFQGGTQIVQNETRTFTSANEMALEDAGNWTLASDVTARDYTLNVSAVNATAEDDPFRLCVSESGSLLDDLDDCDPESEDARLLSIYETEPGTVTIETAVPDGPDAECETDSGDVHLDLADGTLEGDHCPVGAVFGELDSYDIAYLNGDRIEGQYRLIVDAEREELSNALELGDRYNDPGDGDGPPYAYDAIWSAELAVAYESSQIEYETTVTAVPGEIDD